MRLDHRIDGPEAVDRLGAIDLMILRLSTASDSSIDENSAVVGLEFIRGMNFQLVSA